MVDQVVNDPTCFGDEYKVVFPRPSWPLLLAPQAQSVPSVLMANAEAEDESETDSSENTRYPSFVLDIVLGVVFGVVLDVVVFDVVDDMIYYFSFS